MQSNHMGLIAVSVSQRRRQSWLTSEFQGPITEKLKFHKPEWAWRHYSDLGMTTTIMNVIGKVKKVRGIAYWSISKHSQDQRCTELSASPRGRGSRAQKYTIASALRELLCVSLALWPWVWFPGLELGAPLGLKTFGHLAYMHYSLTLGGGEMKARQGVSPKTEAIVASITR